jgi:small nuclear ribonucleoprotein (snRNP)-like protein
MPDSAVDSRRNVSLVRALLLRRLRVALVDGRVIEGILECVDYLRNLVMRDAVDVSGPYPLGLVLVPGDAYRSVLVRRVTKVQGVPDGMTCTESLSNHADGTECHTASCSGKVRSDIL